MSAIYAICVGFSLYVSWLAMRWLADRTTFKSRAGTIAGRAISSTLLGAILGFLFSGLCLEILLSRTGSDYLVSNGSLLGDLSSFAAATLGGSFGVVWGLFWGLKRGFRDVKAMQNASGINRTVNGLPSWFFPTLILGLAVYSVGTSFQTQPYNIFGQFCQRAVSTSQRVGEACFRAEWFSIGFVLALLSYFLWSSKKKVQSRLETEEGEKQ